MNATFHCPSCHKATRVPVSADTSVLDCTHCHQQIAVPLDAISGKRLNRCLVCPSTDLFARKDFPQKLGVGLVIAAIIGSSIAWANYHVFWTFAILFGTALTDLALYIIMGESLTCYRCNAQYRGFEDIELHGGFDLETHERHRQLVARLKERKTNASQLTSQPLS